MKYQQLDKLIGNLPASVPPGVSVDDEIERFLNILKQTSFDGSIPVYISTPTLYCYGLVISESFVRSLDLEAVFHWHFGISRGWTAGRIIGGSREEPEPYTSSPAEQISADLPHDSIPIVFLRPFEARPDQTRSLEVDQRVTHFLRLHWIESKQAFCRLNENADLEEVLRVQEQRPYICSIERTALDVLRTVTGKVFIRFVDYHISSPSVFPLLGEYKREESTLVNHDLALHARIYVGYDEDESLSWLKIRGFQVLEGKLPPTEIDPWLFGEAPDSQKDYVSFIAHDWKNDRIAECSCDPSHLGTYFMKDSSLPFQTSPAFFRPEVLARYQQDPDKYSVEPRTISCHGSWSLHYDVNNEGQVHAYLGDLSYLPYSEQRYWQAFNEEPKGGISERAIQNDFYGRWYPEDDPLEELCHILERFPNANVRGQERAIWMLTIDPTRLRSRLHYVVTESRKEWKDRILELSKILVEGFDRKLLAEIARGRGLYDKKLEKDRNLGSIALLERIIEASDETSLEALIISGPLRETQRLRSASVAHSGGSVPAGDLQKQYRTLLEQCRDSMKKLSELITMGFFDQ